MQPLRIANRLKDKNSHLGTEHVEVGYIMSNTAKLIEEGIVIEKFCTHQALSL